MKNKYLLKGTFFRSPNDQKNLVEINEIFEDVDIRSARKNAMRKFQSYIDVLLESLGLQYESDDQAQKDLQKFVKSHKKKKDFIIPEFEVDEDFDKGLYLYFIPEGSKTFTSLEGEKIYENKYLIRYLDNGFLNLEKNVKDGILRERLTLNMIMLKEKIVDDGLNDILEQLDSYKR